MPRRFIRFLVLGLWAVALSGCARVNDMSLGWFSSTVDAYAIVNNQLLTGQVKLSPDRTARLLLSGSSGAVRACFGSMRYSASHAGVLDLRCNDGTLAKVNYAMLSDTRGYGYGQSAGGAVSMTFGLAPADARAYLTAPEGSTLVYQAEADSLVLQATP